MSPAIPGRRATPSKRPSSPTGGHGRLSIVGRWVARMTISRHTPCGRKGCADLVSSQHANSAHPPPGQGVCGFRVVVGGCPDVPESGSEQGAKRCRPPSHRTGRAPWAPAGRRRCDPLQEEGVGDFVPPFEANASFTAVFSSGAEGRPAGRPTVPGNACGIPFGTPRALRHTPATPIDPSVEPHNFPTPRVRGGGKEEMGA
jgi:hypothetical protein